MSPTFPFGHKFSSHLVSFIQCREVGPSASVNECAVCLWVAVLSDCSAEMDLSLWPKKPTTPAAPAQVILTVRREEMQKAIDFQINQKQNSGVL